MPQHSSLERAAIVLNSLPKKQAAKILSRMEAVDIRRVFDTLDQIDAITSSELNEAYATLDQETQTARGNLPTVTPPTYLPSASQSLDGPFEFLVDLKSDIRAQIVADEHPKHIAVILAELPTDVGSDLMKSLDPVTRVSVLKRLCQTMEISENELAELRYAIKLRLNRALNSQYYSQDGINVAADLLSCTDDETLQSVLEYINQSDPDLAKELDVSVFRFSELIDLSARDVKTVLKNTDTTLWAPALKEASHQLRKKVLSNMAEAPARILSGEIAELGDIAPNLASLARQQIVNQIVQLNRRGKIELPKSVSV